MITKRSLLAIVVLSCSVLRSNAEEWTVGQEMLSVTCTNVSETFTQSKAVNGLIDSIVVDVVTAGTTGTVSVVAESWVSTVANVDLVASAARTADVTVRPRFDGTDTSGNALTNDPPAMYASAGNVKLSLSDCSNTGVVFRAIVTYRKK